MKKAVTNKAVTNAAVTNAATTSTASDRLRLDKWLWAARFFRTRAQAKTAIEAGRVQVNSARAKPARDINVGFELTIRRGDEEFTVHVLALSDERRGAPEAQTLYQETPDSAQRRNDELMRRRVAGFGVMAPTNRPTKKDRRDFDRWRQRQDDPQ